MKKKYFKKLISIIISFIMIFAIFYSGIKNLVPEPTETSAESAVEHKILYSKTNAPVFYGATKITIDKDVTSEFSVNDSRFRIYATDFEDGDLTPVIKCVSNNVVPNVAGNYEIKYSVKDSHNNETKITVPVLVNDETGEKCVIERTLYTLASDWNIALINVARNRNGDRQNLGIYMPEGSSVKIRVLNSDSNLTLQFLGNYETKESSVSINKNQTEFLEVKNTKNSTDYDSVPFLTSVVQSEGESVNKIYKVEISFDSTVKTLDYYHYKDDEQKFFENWKTSENGFSVVDCQAMQVIVPFSDVDKITKSTNSSAIGSLDETLEYFVKVIDRMDEILGVSINPDSPLNQRVRMKYFVKANGNKTSIGAYYTNNHIGIGSSSAWPVFTYGWGTLHECGHGYQGFLGQGSGAGFNMCLNETGNNVFAHYIQSDKTIYKASGNGVGILKNVENNYNSKRLNGEEIFNNNSGTYTNTNEKLYMIVNMLDSFEGAETYAKLYKYFRKIVYNEGSNVYTIPEIYTKFFAEEYGANIMPYLYSWKLPIGSSVAYMVMQQNLKIYSILGDDVSENSLTKVKDSENISLTYGLVNEEILKKHNLNGSLQLTINSQNFEKLKNHYALFYQNGVLIKSVKITSSTLSIDSLPVGTYEVRLPVDYDYDNDTFVLTIKEGVNQVTYNYVNTTKDYSVRSQKLLILGIHGYAGSIGCSIQLSDSNKKATISYGGGDLGNRGAPWTTTRLDDTYISVKILDNSENVVFEKIVKGNEYFITNGAPENPVLDVDYGYVIKVTTERPNLVRVKAVETDTEVSEYNSTSKELSYKITKSGLKFLNIENFDEEQVLYNATKSRIVKVIDDYKNSATEAELGNKRLNAKRKVEVINAFNALSDDDRNEFLSFIEKIKTGGKPVITSSETVYKIKQNEQLDLYSLIKISDVEDGVIESCSDNVEILTEFNNKIAGDYKVLYKVYDFDGNVTTYEIQIEVVSSNVIMSVVIGVLVVLLMVIGILVAVKTSSKSTRKKVS